MMDVSAIGPKELKNLSDWEMILQSLFPCISQSIDMR